MLDRDGIKSERLRISKKCSEYNRKGGCPNISCYEVIHENKKQQNKLKKLTKPNKKEMKQMNIKILMKNEPEETKNKR